jgi:hypothetical protein
MAGQGGWQPEARAPVVRNARANANLRMPQRMPPPVTLKQLWRKSPHIVTSHGDCLLIRNLEAPMPEGAQSGEPESAVEMLGQVVAEEAVKGTFQLFRSRVT